jgi:uncharacterized membrane protein YjjB (DUF3815 family)
MTDFFTLTLLVRIVASYFASLGFAVVFRIHRRHLAIISLGGAITYFLYDLVLYLSASCFLAGLLSTVFAALFSEILARVRRAPTVVFLLPCVIPTIPGGNLYFPMRYLLSGESALSLEHLAIALQVALGVAGGIIIVSVVFGIVMDRIAANKRKK